MALEPESTNARFESRIEALSERKPPPGRKAIIPRVYEGYKDEDELVVDDDYERTHKKISSSDSEHSDASLQAKKKSTKTRKERAAEYQARYDAWFKREEEERVRKQEAQRLEDLRFPNKCGWFYTNGLYEDGPYGVKGEYVDAFNRMEDEFEADRRKRDPETFTQKFKRHFWPPHKLCSDCCFRTRGSYMDFPEVQANQVPEIDVDFDKGKHEILNNEDVALKEEEDYDPYAEDDGGGGGGGGDAAAMEGEVEDYKRKPFTYNEEVGWESYYYDDELGQFFLKVPGLEVEYYFDSKNSCWRRKRGNKLKAIDQETPYDYYFDQGEFHPREKFWGKHTLDIAFDKKLGVWKFDPKVSTRLLIQSGILDEKPSDSMADTTASSATGKSTRSRKGKEKAKRKKLKKKKVETMTQDKDGKWSKAGDYYFDEEATVWKKKGDAGIEVRLENDENGRRWIKRFEGDWRGLTGNSPDDYYWDNAVGKFFPRPKRLAENYEYSTVDGVWRPIKAGKTNSRNRLGLGPADYYFVDGQFRLKQPNSEHLYRKLRYALIYKLRDKPLSGKYPQDFYWDADKKLWLPRNIRMTVLKAKKEELPWNKDNVGKKPPSVPGRDDWYYDDEEGIFIKKTVIGKNTNAYYFDSEDGVWKSVELRDKHRLYKFPHDFFWNKNHFSHKDPKKSDSDYVYNSQKGVYYAKDASTKDKKGKGPSDFFFDYELEMWKSKSGETEDSRPRGATKSKSAVTIVAPQGSSTDVKPSVAPSRRSVVAPSVQPSTRSVVAPSVQPSTRSVVPPSVQPSTTSTIATTASGKPGKRKKPKKSVVIAEGEGVEPATTAENTDANPDVTPTPSKADVTGKKDQADQPAEAAIEVDSSGHYARKFPGRKSPDDYYFDDSEGRFREKNPQYPARAYYFQPNEGCYKLHGKTGPSLNGLNSRDFFWDDYESRWRLKVVGQDKEYLWDKNNHLFRHIVALKPKTGLTASDYYFSPPIGRWFPVMNDPNRGKMFNERLEWDPLRNYDKPWRTAAPTRYGKNLRSKSKRKGKKAGAEGWEGQERIPFDRPVQDGGSAFDLQENQDFEGTEDDPGLPPYVDENSPTGEGAPGEVPEEGKTQERENVKTRMKMLHIDIFTTNPPDIKLLFPTATKVEIVSIEEAAYITFPSLKDSRNAQRASKTMTYKEKPLILVPVEKK